MANITMTLHRKVLAVGFTLGTLVFGGVQYYSVEDQVRVLENCTKTTCNGKINGVTAIPAGTYEIKDTYSPKYKRNVLLIDKVGGFSGVRIHSGNSADDTEACLLLGLKGTEKGVAESRKAIEQFNKDVRAELIKGNKVFIKITNDAPIVGIEQ